mgnify:CR=1 FL=1
MQFINDMIMNRRGSSRRGSSSRPGGPRLGYTLIRGPGVDLPTPAMIQLTSSDEEDEETLRELNQATHQQFEHVLLDVVQQNAPVCDGLGRRGFNALPKKKVGASARKCVFCFEEFKREEVIRLLPCTHYFHNHCLRPWFDSNTACPVCRFDVKKYFEDPDSN